ncbi:conserved Plasmodium protein, unknown function [Plasmodium gaboni]|uniref:Uncharacterized protein n=1 Tax=Plasmodium gaboni TaxID=647221 RepID=A0ABY1UTB7_9APIC|nr:conserved Plasmodium protein, unknown function [Plasmodium gaboni]
MGLYNIKSRMDENDKEHHFKYQSPYKFDSNKKKTINISGELKMQTINRIKKKIPSYNKEYVLENKKYISNSAVPDIFDISTYYANEKRKEKQKRLSILNKNKHNNNNNKKNICSIKKERMLNNKLCKYAHIKNKNKLKYYKYTTNQILFKIKSFNEKKTNHYKHNLDKIHSNNNKIVKNKLNNQTYHSEKKNIISAPVLSNNNIKFEKFNHKSPIKKDNLYNKEKILKEEENVYTCFIPINKKCPKQDEKIYNMDLIKNLKYLDTKMKNYINEQIKYYGENWRQEYIIDLYFFIKKNYQKKDYSSDIFERNKPISYYPYKYKSSQNNEKQKYKMLNKILSTNSCNENKDYLLTEYSLQFLNLVDTYNIIDENCDNIITENNIDQLLNKKQNLIKKLNEFKLNERKYFFPFYQVYTYLKNQQHIFENILKQKKMKYKINHKKITNIQNNDYFHCNELIQIELKIIRFLNNFQQIIKKKHKEKDQNNILPNIKYDETILSNMYKLIKMVNEVTSILKIKLNK